MKKILSIVLALSMVFMLSAGTIASAAADDYATTGIIAVSENNEEATDTDAPSVEPEVPSDEPTEEPTVPGEDEISDWFAVIIAKVLAILSKICEVIFDNIIW